MNGVKEICLSCRYFRLESVEKGICRVDKENNKNYPTKKNDDVCARWQDCGQQYFIRRGWIKAEKTRAI